MVELRAGAGKAKIQFRQEDFPLKAFIGIHDSIHVRVLVLESKVSMALVSVELTSLPAEAVRRFQKECSMITNIDEKNIFVSVTHTFSAPHIPPQINNSQEQRLSDIMYERIREALCRASSEAKETLGPALMEYCETPCCLNVNRNTATPEGWWIGRNEEAFSDHRVRVLRFRRESLVFAYVMNYDIQPSVMDKSEAACGGRLISGDLAGAACTELEEQGVVAVFLPGCAGDQAPVLQAVQRKAEGKVCDIHEAGFVLVQQMGKYLAERVEAAEELRPQKAGDRTCSGLEEADIRMVSDTALLPEQNMKYPTKELRPQKQYSFDLTGGEVRVPAVYVYLGDIGMLFTTPELNSGFGTKIRKILGEKLLIGTLVNGGVKYLPEEEDFKRITYEAMNTTLGPRSAEKFLETISGLKEKGKGREEG